MEYGNFSIDWKDFEALATNRFKNLVGQPDFSDVTLVSGDGQRIPGHQVILATGCTFFRNLLKEEKKVNPKPLIFLRGVVAILIEPLLNFLYTGKANVAEDLITDFLMLAEDLGVEGLANNLDKDYLVELENKPTLKETKMEISEGKAEQISQYTVGGPQQMTNDPTTKSSLTPFSCDKCGKSFTSRITLKKHIQKGLVKPTRCTSVNSETIRIPPRSSDGFYHCQFCEVQIRDNSNMKRHIRKRHQQNANQSDLVVKSTTID